MAYQEALTSLVADECYVQTLRRRRGGGQRREFASEVVMVHGGAQSEWIMLRDVLSVDGRLIRNRKERVLGLLRSAAPDALAAARRIAEEGAPFNIGRLTRTFNVPDMALSVLRPEHAPRIRHDSLRSQSMDGVRHFVSRFQEHHGVPIKMTETCVQPEELIEGSAEYSNFRRFSVNTSEKLTNPPGP